ncbi:Cytochrome b5-like Heme/Steroid binding domain-containing protein [Spironucleus salmonicida]|uniref:Cytochrome b5-like Heme/Steroid binding domain-containing protein n=1 Tax=Spironucleus salmonicida TaxID=348837 RepID=V6LWM9_9EUKA|nr:Cytochrome b5-like Heme/Steroid binding domain-containing protein [Spironucleus salmonicida]|eukprot:EST49047.1 Cytochrome b5-like Heme/Steroid binding domain-containing protein [Spironucleus salmonicida]
MSIKDMTAADLNQNGRQHIVMGGVVFDVTDYISRHPGQDRITDMGVDDSFRCLIKHHGKNMPELEKRLTQLVVGRIVGGPSQDIKDFMDDVEFFDVAVMFKQMFNPE